jgi:hypothetical protein
VGEDQFMRKISIILFSLITFNAWAISKDFCSVQLIALDNSTAQRQVLLNKAFATIALRVSGQTSVLQSPELKHNLEEDLLKLVQNYTYKFQENQQIFAVTFDYPAVKKKLMNSGFEILPDTRPYTIAWLTLTDENQQTIVLSSDSNHSVKTILEKKSIDFGLPLILPLLDFADTTAIEVQDILDVNKVVLEAVSKKYAAQNFLVGNLSLENGLWKAHISLLNYPDAVWITSSDSLEQIVELIFNNMAVAIIHGMNATSEPKIIKPVAPKQAELKQETTILPSPQSSNELQETLTNDEESMFNMLTPTDNLLEKPTPLAIEHSSPNQEIEPSIKPVKAGKQLSLHISGINDLNKYATIISYLRHIDGINEVEVAELGEDSALFILESALPIKDLSKMIAKDKFLTAAVPVVQGNEMRFILSS